LARNVVNGYIYSFFSLMECSIYYYANWFVSKYVTTQVSYY